MREDSKRDLTTKILQSQKWLDPETRLNCLAHLVVKGGRDVGNVFDLITVVLIQAEFQSPRLDEFLIKSVPLNDDVGSASHATG